MKSNFQQNFSQLQCVVRVIPGHHTVCLNPVSEYMYAALQMLTAIPRRKHPIPSDLGS